jgi:hypothetical protein
VFPVSEAQRIINFKSGISPIPMLFFDQTENKGTAMPERLFIPILSHLSAVNVFFKKL